MFHGFDRRIWIRFWGVTLLNIGNFMIRPFLTLYLATALGAGLGIISVVLMIRPIGSFFGGMLGGYYADKIGRKPVMLFGLLFDALAIFGYAMTDDVIWFAVMSFVQGMAASFAEPANSAMIADVTTEDNRARAYSLMYMGVNIGAAVGPLLAVGVILNYPVVLFTVMSVLHLLYAAVVYFFIPESKPTDTMCESEACRQSRNKIGYGFIWKDSKLVFFLLGTLAISLGYNQMSSYLPLHLNSVLPEAAWLYGVMMSMNGVLCVVLSMPAAKFLARCNAYSVMKYGSAIYTAGMFLLALNQNAWMMLGGYTVFTIGEIICAAVQNKLIADFAPADMRARYMSAASISWVAAATVGPLAGGQLMQGYGGQVMLLVFAVLMSASVLFFRLLHLRRMREQQGANAFQPTNLAH